MPTAATANRYRIRAVASFASPSPSRITSKRLGIRNRRAIESGATASGGDTIAPSTKPTDHGRPINQFAAAATTAVVKTTHPTARAEIGRKLNRNSRQLMATAAE